MDFGSGGRIPFITNYYKSCCSWLSLKCFIQKFLVTVCSFAYLSPPFLIGMTEPRRTGLRGWLSWMRRGIGWHCLLISWFTSDTFSFSVNLTKHLGDQERCQSQQWTFFSIIWLSGLFHMQQNLCCFSPLGHQCLRSGKRHRPRAVPNQWTLLWIGQCKSLKVDWSNVLEYLMQLRGHFHHYQFLNNCDFK